MNTWWLVIVAALGCAPREPLERLSAPAAPDLAASLERPPPPPPPPPPPVPGPRPPPAQITNALRGRECVPRVSLHHLDVRDGGRRFLGYRERRRYTINATRASELVTRLLRDDGYVDGGDVGCVGDPIGIRIECAGAVVDVVEDCTHLYLTEAHHDGEWVLLSEEAGTFVRELRR